MAFGGAVALWMGEPPPYRIDAWGVALAERWAGTDLRAALRVFTHLGGVPAAIGIALLLGGWLYRRCHTQIALWWLGAFGAGAGLVFALKLAFDRTRPRAPGLLETDFSFPSGHAFMATLIYGAVALTVVHRVRSSGLRWFAGGGAALLVLGIGGSRVVLGVHFVTDVIGGMALGGAWLSATWLLLHRHCARLSSATRSPR